MLIHGGPCNCYLIKVLGAPWVHKALESLTRELLSQILQEEKKSHVDSKAITHLLPHSESESHFFSVSVNSAIHTHQIKFQRGARNTQQLLRNNS